MKVKIEIKNRWTGKPLFEFELENNSVKETLVEAVGQDANLRGADLRGADLRGANLQYANLRYANLRGADLRGANLRGADLRYADLQGAYLQYANLQYADLRDANLRDANLQDADLQYANLQDANLRGANLLDDKIQTAAIFTGLYDHIVIPYITELGEKRVKMGCYNRSLEDWEADFWNNPSEFPNNGSAKSNLRLMAFNTAKSWFEIIEPSLIKTEAIEAI